MVSEKPESILLASHLWLWVVGLEVVHQVLSVVAGVLAPEVLLKQVREQQSGLPEATLHTIVYASIVATGLLAIAIMGVVLWMAVALSRGGSFAAFARRGLLFFGVYLGIRTLFVLIPQATTLSVWWVLADGFVQIIVGVLAVLAVYLVTRRESLQWTGETHG